jgi:hypothetical protein
MPIGDWSKAVLCEDSDLIEFESNVLNWTRSRGDCSKWRSKAKDIITNKLRHAFRSAATSTDEDILDLIGDTGPLKDAACYMTLHLLCNDLSTGEDHWERKGEMYWTKFGKEWPIAYGLISLDIDESGAIEKAEMYNTPGVKMVRGS